MARRATPLELLLLSLSTDRPSMRRKSRDARRPRMSMLRHLQSRWNLSQRSLMAALNSLIFDFYRTVTGARVSHPLAQQRVIGIHR